MCKQCDSCTQFFVTLPCHIENYVTSYLRSKNDVQPLFVHISLLGINFESPLVIFFMKFERQIIQSFSVDSNFVLIINIQCQRRDPLTHNSSFSELMLVIHKFQTVQVKRIIVDVTVDSMMTNITYFHLQYCFVEYIPRGFESND